MRERICPVMELPCQRDCPPGDCKGPRLEGTGEEVLRIPVEHARRISDLPHDVEILDSLPPPNGGRTLQYHPAWYTPGDQPKRPRYIWLHIRHRYCIRVPPGGVLSYGELDEFLARYRQLTEQGR